MKTTSPDPTLATAENTLCMAPWKSLVLEPNGDIKPCCAYNKPLGKYQSTDDLESVWNGEELARLRENLGRGIQPTECSTCFLAEREGRVSKRLKLNRLATMPESSRPVAFELCFSNTCNLTCVMCNSYFSHRWREWEKELPQSLQRQGCEKFFIKDSDIQDLIAYTSSARDIEVLGGEPAINPTALHFIETLLEKNQDVSVTLTTNLTKLTPQFLDLVSKYKRLVVNVSLDGTGKVYEYVRGFSFERVSENFKRLLENSANKTLLLHHTTSILNIANVPDFHRWLVTLQRENPNFSLKPRYDQIVADPAYLQVSLLESEKRELIAQELQSFDEDCLDQLIHYLRYSPTPSKINHLLNQMRDFTEFMNKKRGFDILPLLPLQNINAAVK